MRNINRYSATFYYDKLTVKGPKYAIYPADRSMSPATLLIM